MGSTSTSILEILRNANSPIDVVTSRQTPRPFMRLLGSDVGGGKAGSYIRNGELPRSPAPTRSGARASARRSPEPLFRLDRRDGRPAMSHSRRIGHCTPHGDASSPRQTERSRSRCAAVLLQKSRRRHLSRRTRCNAAPRSPFACCQHLNPQAAGGMDGASATNR
jgi:hypothetical protein